MATEKLASKTLKNQCGKEQKVFTVGNLQFYGPLKNASELESRSAVFVLIALEDNSRHVVDFGYASNVKQELVDESTGEFKLQLKAGELEVGLIYLEKASDAESLVQEIESWFDQANEPMIEV